MRVLKRALLLPFYFILGFSAFGFLAFYESTKIIFNIFSINQEKENKVE